MRVEYDQAECDGWFQCTQKWDALEMNMADGKAELTGAEEMENGVFVREIPEDAEDAVRAAAEACPVDAIRVYEGDEQIIP